MNKDVCIRNQQFDIIVLGGGPAGTLCATELVADGKRVLLFDPQRSAQRIEGLSPRAYQLLGQKGFTKTLRMCTSHLPRRSHWAGISQQENGERLVNRAGLDQAMRDDAIAAGVQLLAQRATLSQQQTGKLPEVVSAAGQRFTADFVVDARGRQANRRNLATKAPCNLAISAFINHLLEPIGTTIRPLDNGWLWLASINPLAPTWAQLMIDGDVEKLNQSLLREKLYQAIYCHRANATHAKVQSPILARAADFRLNQPADLLQSNFIPIGDAAAAFDPLSGHGIFWALSSALSAAAVVRTLLRDPTPQARAMCRDFYLQRQNASFWRQSRIGRDFYQLESSRTLPFWCKRQQWPDQLPAHATACKRPQITKRCAIRDGYVVATDVLELPDEYGPLAWFGDIHIASALQRWYQYGNTSDADFQRFRRISLPDSSEKQSQAFFHWLQQKQLLHPAFTEGGN